MTYSDREIANPAGILLSIEGPEKTGKTWLPLNTLPEPVVYVNCDRSNDRLLRVLKRRGRKILASEPHIFVAMPTDDILRQQDKEVLAAVAARALVPWKAFKHEYLTALKDPNVRSVVADSGTKAYVNCRLGRFGKLLEVAPVLYSKTNFEFANLLQIAHESDKVVVWINRIGDEYSRGTDSKGREVSNKTGGTKTLGYKEFNYEMDAIVRTDVDGDGNFSAEIYREGVGRPDVRGLRFEGEELTMPHILAKLTGTKKERWL